LERLVHRMERNEFDLIAVGRAILNDPLWVTKIRTGDTQGLRDFSAADFGQLV
jgi:2,4-dienoyl-CoA reductase-like NADH-dependent reductase (Old Yellow Enzyme family)